MTMMRPSAFRRLKPNHPCSAPSCTHIQTLGSDRNHSTPLSLCRVEFGFFDPHPTDFHGVRALLANNANGLPVGTAFDVGALADVLCEQTEVGSVAKVIAPGTDGPDPAQDDVLGFMSAVSLHRHKRATFARELTDSFKQRCADALARATLQDLLEAETTGFIVSCRMLNLPPVLVPSLVDSLMQDIAWALEHCEDVAERRAFDFRTLLLAADVELHADEEGGDGGGDGDEGGGGSEEAEKEEEEEEEKKKKKKKRAEAAEVEGLAFARPEEEVLAQHASWSTLLAGAGRSRQLLMSLTPDAIRGAVPALRAVMAE